jgi:hypothetical protein
MEKTVKLATEVLKGYMERYRLQIRGWLMNLRKGPVESSAITRENGLPDAVCAAELAGFCRARRMTNDATLADKDRWEWTITPEGRSWMEW